MTAGARRGATGVAVVTAITGACCAGPAVGPLIVSVLGASGAVRVAWLEPYTSYLLVGSFLLLCWAFWSMKRERVCAAEDRSPPRSVAMLWIAFALWMGSLLVNFFVQ